MQLENSTLAHLQHECHRIAKDKGFWDKERNISEALMLVVSELGEAVEALRKNKRSDLSKFEDILNAANVEELNETFPHLFSTHIKDTFEDELADAVIRLLDLAGGLGIDLEKHINFKLTFNATRARLHGKQF